MDKTLNQRRNSTTSSYLQSGQHTNIIPTLKKLFCLHPNQQRPALKLIFDRLNHYMIGNISQFALVTLTYR